ncbi:response regulator [Motilibacter deserti]|uniref:Response regulator n=1 Tax=Motilibacter deserti TaxID=2714956 RepID=A0ABX0GWF0_9ACTN|nr:response regulator [Motilibacter deserti]NHC15283.1 response regulator [Motilibacter deserti]
MSDQDTSRPRALVVDDAPTVRLYHGEILRSAGFDVDEAGNGFEALELALATAYDLLVVDVNMPQMDGYELLTRLRSDEVALTCPVVTISTEADEPDADNAYRAGANLYLVKPVAPDLLEHVAGVLTSSLPAPWSAS